ncbi:MAG: hypothetical protein KDA31_09005 [Phycisphaerales bacterium]|nr:hypothetical protein [Phycisphaerales bacterium]MCB9836839.1 hypothetical protein [Phycisphaera sp.]
MTVSQHHDPSLDELRPRKSNVGKFILVGCLSIVIAGLLLGGIGTVVVWKNWRGWTANFSTAALDETLKGIHLPNEEHDALMQRARLLADEFVQKRITVDEFQKLGDALTESEFMPMLIAKAMYGGYIAPSTLSDEEKARGQLVFGRLARGFVDKKLVDDDFEAVLAPLGKSGQYSINVDSDSKSGFSMRSPQQVSAEDLLEVIARAEKLAEEKELSPEPLNVDIVQELDRIVEETLGRKIIPPGEK